LTIKKFWAACVIWGLSVILLSNCSPPPTKAEIGRPAPNFTLEDLDGRAVSPDQYKGKIVMLEFWATWCGPCRITMPMLEMIQKEYSDIMVLLSINLMEPEDIVRNYVLEQDINSIILLDEQGSVGMKYGAEAIPLQVLLDKKGIVRYIKLGLTPPSRIRAEIENLR
jgi:thiol-disulfide isomerase/thioredoxin